MPSAPVPSSRTHNFPNGKPFPLAALEVLYLGTAVGWFLYWWLGLGFTSWLCGLPLVFIVIAYAILQSQVLTHYERKGDAVRIGRPPTKDVK